MRYRRLPGQPAGSRRRREDRFYRAFVRPVRCSRTESAAQLAIHGRAGAPRQVGRRGLLRGRHVRQQGQSAGSTDPAQVGDRPGHTLRHPGQWLGRGLCPDRRHQQAQRAQSRQGDRLLELRLARPRYDERQMQLLALSLRRQLRHEDGSRDQRAGQRPSHQEGLHHRTELRIRAASQSGGEGVSGAQAAGYPDRGRRPAPDWAGQGFFTLRGENQGLRRRRGDHRQFRPRPHVAGQGRQGRRPQGEFLYLQRGHHRRSDSDGRCRGRPRQGGVLLASQQRVLLWP